MLDDDRPFRLIVPGIDHRFMVEGWEAVEALARPYRVRVRAKVDGSPEKLFDLSRQRRPARLEVWTNGRVARRFHGHIEEVLIDDTDERVHLTLAPVLELDGQRVDCRIFQDKSVPEIVTELLREFVLGAHWELRLQESYEKREYCVQFQESTRDFVQRLLEEEGIFYAYCHEPDRHVLILADHIDAFGGGASAKGAPVGSVVEPEGLGPTCVELAHRDHAIDSEGVVTSWTRVCRARPTRFATADYDPLQPDLCLQARDGGTEEGPEDFEWPGRVTNENGARRRVEVRRQSADAAALHVRAESHAPILGPGRAVVVTGPGDGKTSLKHWVVGVQHAGQQSLEASDGRLGPSYSNHVSAIPGDTSFRPSRSVVRPRIRGIQTAFVVGAAHSSRGGDGREVLRDPHGRIKVQFHWDRLGQRDERSSCWVRLAQVWAGDHFGVHFTPRVGQEVIVSFLDGDPDRPVIIGSVHNAATPSPPQLLEPRVNGLVTRSSPDGARNGGNNLIFDDRKGEERLAVTAERDLVVVVKNDRSAEIAQNDKEVVHGDQSTRVGKSRVVEVKDKDVVKARCIEIHAEDALELVVGGSRITLDASGVRVEGPMIWLN
ncbi:MAG: type VI secretion system Vgr family protein [Planctomycetota bacterium]